MQKISHDEVRKRVRNNYGKVAEAAVGNCSSAPGCCTAGSSESAEKASIALGYSEKEVSSIPQGANMGLGCGNPQSIASLQPGETVLDLGSGGGVDCFLAAQVVGESGQVIGVDMTPEMVSKARNNGAKAGYTNVEFRLGEIENLPVADGVVDVIISNCVINLSPEKSKVFREAFRVLKPGGRLAISDVVATAELPESIKQDMSLFTGCMSGASTVRGLESMLTLIGFENVRIKPKDESKEFIREWAPGHNIDEYVLSATIEANKPVV